jgi:hypothetical protein
VNDVSSQEEIITGLNFIRQSIVLKPDHIDYLKTIDKDNISNAVRVLIDTFMKHKRLLSFEKYLTTFAFGLALVGIGTILPNLYISLASMGTGAFCILFSLAMYSRSRIKYDKGE